MPILCPIRKYAFLLRYFSLFALFGLCVLYATCFICSIYPFFLIHVIKNHDFGMYAITQIIFCILITYLSISINVQKALQPLLKNKAHLIFIIGLGLCLRLNSWWVPHHTTDLFRYFSDGLNIMNNQNPYANHTIGEEVAYPNYRTIYPLLTQVFFTFGAWLDTWFEQKEKIYKIIFGLVELCFLFWVLKKFIFSKGFLLKKKQVTLFYFISLNPLLIFECHTEGHLEIFSIFLFLYASLLLHSRRYVNVILPAIFAFLSFLAKFHGLLLYPIIFLGSLRLKNSFIWKSKKKIILWMLFIGLASIASLIPFVFQSLDENRSGMYQYFESWYFGSGVFSLLHFFLVDSKKVISLLQLMIILLGLYHLIIWFCGCLRTHALVFRFTLFFLFLFPVQHPWYFLLGFYGVLFSPRYRFFWMILMSCIGLNYINYSHLLEKKNDIILSWLPWVLALTFEAGRKLWSSSWRKPAQD